MLRIERLRVRLPDGMQRRAGRIVAQAARELGAMPLESDARVGRVSVPAVETSPEMPDDVVAHLLARAVHRQIGSSA